MICSVALALTLLTTNPFEEAMRWLPPQAETLMVLRGKGVSFKKDRNGPYLSDLPLGMSKKIHHQVGDIRAEFVLFSAGQFKYPKGIGIGQYNGAIIAKFQPDRFKQVEKLLHASKMKTFRVVGESVWSTNENTTEGELTEVCLWAKDGWLVMTTNPTAIATVLGRRSKPTGNRILPVSLPEWQYVDTSADFYAVRHIDRNTWLRDMGMNLGDNLRTGMVSFQRSGEGLRVISLSNSPNAHSIVRQVWTGNGLNPTYRDCEQGVTEISFPADRNQQTMALFCLAIGLGFPIAV